MTDDRPDAPIDTATDPLEEYTSSMAERLGALRWVAEFGTPRIYVDRSAWVETLGRARDEEGLAFFSWLSGIDWAKDAAVGDGVADPDALTERFEVICRLSSVVSGDAMHFLAEVPKDDPVIDSIVSVFAGAAWHERECHEMFGIDFRGHPYLAKLYLPDGFEGHPLRKSYPLLSREVKPWPGTVDVEDKPSLENPEVGGTS